MVSINFESPDQPDVISLIAELDAYQSALYPPESHHALDLTSVAAAQMFLVVARDAAGLAIACGAVVLPPEYGDGYGELKRMYVRPAHRGLHIATEILTVLEFAAKKSGCTLLKLETGPKQPEAIRFYASCGYRQCGPFGAYGNDPLSIFMQRNIAA
ncbi:MAG: GNAT family N-acetyltransferase [Undibacterium sp.]|nr:GNAT family N-acetyltransferase [Undibacterium sp.]